jgi:hypothetical protein
MGVPIHVTSKENAPKQEHYAIMKFDTRSTSTYEMNDGCISVIIYEAYLDRAAWLAEIEHLERDRGHGPTPYYACIIKPVEPKIKVSVDVD